MPLWLNLPPIRPRLDHSLHKTGSWHRGTEAKLRRVLAAAWPMHMQSGLLARAAAVHQQHTKREVAAFGSR